MAPVRRGSCSISGLRTHTGSRCASLFGGGCQWHRSGKHCFSNSAEGPARQHHAASPFPPNRHVLEPRKPWGPSTLSSMRSQAATGTRSNLPIRIVGSSPRHAAAYEPFLDSPKYFLPAAGTDMVLNSPSITCTLPWCFEHNTAPWSLSVQRAGVSS